jgi:hypothetical protein
MHWRRLRIEKNGHVCLSWVRASRAARNSARQSAGYRGASHRRHGQTRGGADYRGRLPRQRARSGRRAGQLHARHDRRDNSPLPAVPYSALGRAAQVNPRVRQTAHLHSQRKEVLLKHSSARESFGARGSEGEGGRERDGPRECGCKGMWVQGREGQRERRSEATSLFASWQLLSGT